MPTQSSFATITDALEAAPHERPFVTFWIDEDEQETVTFGEFRRLARIQAGLLSRNGVGSGDRVVVIMPQGIDAMAAFAGAMMLNAVPAFLAYPNFKIDPEKYRSGLVGVTANLSARAVVIDEEFPDEMLGYVNRDAAVLLRFASTGNEFLERVEATPGDLSFIQHSAGTTGLQKGVALTHAAVLRHVEHLREALAVCPENDRICSWLPLYHDMGLIACFILPMVCHVPVVMQSPLDWVMRPESMLQIITEHKCTLGWLPNFAFQFVARRTPEARRSFYNLSSMRALINCSEPVRAASIDEFTAAFGPCGLKPSAMHSCYAMAENVFAVSQSDVRAQIGPSRISAKPEIFRAEHRIAETRDDSCLQFVSSGRLLPENHVLILSDSGAILGDGAVGEIAIKSDSLFDGYYNRPDLTAEAIVDGWYHTGDLGFIRDSELYVVGRKKDLLIVGGENVYPQDIEEVISRHPAIHEGRVVVLGIFNPELGTEDIVAVAEVQDPSLHAPAAIENELRQNVIAATGVAVKHIVLKPPKWIVKSTAGKPARAATREKLLREHPDFGMEAY